MYNATKCNICKTKKEKKPHGKTLLQKEVKIHAEKKHEVKEGRPQPIPPRITSTEKESRDPLKTRSTTSPPMRDTKASLE